MELQYTPIRSQWPTEDSVITAFRYLLARPFVEGKKVLELGCGSSDGVEILSAHAKEYVGIDLEPHWGENNSKQDDNVTFIQADACDLPPELEGKFEVVIALELVEHLKDPDVLCSQIRKVLTPNGLAIISTPNFDLLSRGYKGSTKPLFEHHIREYQADEFEQYLKNFEMEFCIHSLSQLPWNSDISENLRIVFDDVLYELKVGQQFPDMEISRKQSLPKSMPLRYSQSFFAVVGHGAGKEPFALNKISQGHPEAAAAMAENRIAMEDACAMSVGWILHRRNEHVRAMEKHIGNMEDIVKDREKQIEHNKQAITKLKLLTNKKGHQLASKIKHSLKKMQ